MSQIECEGYPGPDGDRRPRLLVLSSTYPRWRNDTEPGFVHELTKRLAERFEVVVICPHAPGSVRAEVMDGVEIRRYRYAPVKWETLVNDGGIVANLKRHRWKFMLVPGFFLAQIWEAWRLARRHRFDVVHAHWLLPQGLVAKVLSVLPGFGSRYVVTSHGADLFALRGLLFDSLRRWIIGGAAHSTVVSNAMRSKLLDTSIDAGSVSVLPMGVDMSTQFMPDLTKTRNEDQILFVGRLVEKKGLRHLIDAMPLVLLERPGARLTIVGSGPEAAQLKEQAGRNGVSRQVEFLGSIAHAKLPALYAEATVFVAPFVESNSGDQEGLGLVTVEALSSGCPVVVGDVPAVHDILGDWPECIVDPRDTPLLADRILRVLREPQVARADALRTRAQIAARLDWRVVTRAYSEILMRAVVTGNETSRYVR
jgi:glycosyltransferase involved in cell wall biosynthesis